MSIHAILLAVSLRFVCVSLRGKHVTARKRNAVGVDPVCHPARAKLTNVIAAYLISEFPFYSSVK
ncbi:hypothetical protein, partial [Parvibaculum sp.]|uniref:hypothetical protein n=1 Tax=Parvibaculum sp. TaxID=2024848 RepID=UPI0025E5C006